LRAGFFRLRAGPCDGLGAQQKQPPRAPRANYIAVPPELVDFARLFASAAVERRDFLSAVGRLYITRDLAGKAWAPAGGGIPHRGPCPVRGRDYNLQYCVAKRSAAKDFEEERIFPALRIYPFDNAWVDCYIWCSAFSAGPANRALAERQMNRGWTSRPGD
jgi:hypothetical protein